MSGALVRLSAWILVLTLFGTATSPAPQAQGAASPCDSSRSGIPQLSLLAIQTGRLPPGTSTCLGLTLQRGEFARIAVDADAGYLQARLLGPRRDPLQVTLIWSFFPSLPLVVEAPESGSYLVELRVPSPVPFPEVPTYRVQMLERQSAAERAAGREALRRDPRVMWLRENARRIRSIAPADTNFSDLEFLRETLRASRMVLLGEGDHGGGSDLLAKTRLIKFLHQRMGFDVVVFEAGLHSTATAWRALQTDPNPREALLKGVFGIFGRAVQAEALIEYLAGRARTDRPLEVAGFDSQFTGTAAGTLFPELQEFLKRRGVSSPFTDSTGLPSRVLAGTIDGRFARDRDSLPSPAEQAQTVEALQETAREVERRELDRDGAFWAQVLHSTAVQVGLLLDNLRGGTSRDYMNGRDRQMADNLLWLANRRYAGRKLIVLAHTSHVMRNPEATSQGRVVGYTMGHGVWQALGTESFVIGLTSYDGTTHWLTQPEGFDQDLIPDQHPGLEFEELMDAAGHDLAFVDLRNARARGEWAGGRFVASALYLLPEAAEWSKAVDALFFIRTQVPRRSVR